MVILNQWRSTIVDNYKFKLTHYQIFMISPRRTGTEHLGKSIEETGFLSCFRVFMNLELVSGSTLQFVVVMCTRRTVKRLGLNHDFSPIAGRQLDSRNGVQTKQTYLRPHTRLEFQNCELFGLVLRQTYVVFIKNDVLVLSRRQGCISRITL